MSEKCARVRVNPDLCQGHARCAAVAPTLFEIDDIGNGKEIGDGKVNGEMLDKAYLAQSNCPEGAIEILET
jgi:ferredoxin